MASVDEKYTHIIVGAGSAGCVLANRLTEDQENRVLLLEAGGNDESSIIRRPSGMWDLYTDANYSWGDLSSPQEHLNNRVMLCPSGKVWGGSSSINFMCYVRGHPMDQDRWEKEGVKEWAFANCLPYFKKIENYELGEDDYRGGSGSLHISRGKTRNVLFETFIEAGTQAGYPKTSDMNGFQQEGFGFMDLTIHKGQRWSTADAYLRPALRRSTLEVKSGALATRVLFEGTRAIGVEYEQDGVKGKVLASTDIILSAGAFNSPQLLMLSGIGNADDLNSLGIPVVHHLPGVGENLQNHVGWFVVQACTQPVSAYSQWKFPHEIKNRLQWFLTRTGWESSNSVEAGAFIRSKPEVDHPDVECSFFPHGMNERGRAPGTCHAFQVHVTALRPTSRGSLKLKSADPKERPLIDFNYLAAESDRLAGRRSVKLVREVFSQKAFDPYRGVEILPGPGVQTDEQIDEYVRKFAIPPSHYSSTCKMGEETDPMAVVNSKTEVIGLSGLRVVDASIMPSITSGNTNAPTIMIAEKAADIIRGRAPLDPIHIPGWKPGTSETEK